MSRISGFECVWNLLRCSTPNAFGYCGAFGLSVAVRKYELGYAPRTGLGHRKVSKRNEKLCIIPLTQPTRSCNQR